MTHLFKYGPLPRHLMDFFSIKDHDMRKEVILEWFIEHLERQHLNRAYSLFKLIIIPEVEFNGFFVWDVVPVICQRLCGLSDSHFEAFDILCQQLLELSEVCNPKELLVVYLAELENALSKDKYSEGGAKEVVDIEEEESNDSKECENVEAAEILDINCLLALLKPLEVILLKIPRKRNSILTSVINQINEHIERLPPKDIEKYDFGSKDPLNLITTPSVENTIRVISAYVNFLEVFVKEVDLTDTSSKSNNTNSTNSSDSIIQRTILLKALLKILNHPLRFLDLISAPLEKEECFQSSTLENKDSLIMKNHDAHPHLGNLYWEETIKARVTIIKVIQLVARLHPNYYTLLDRTDLITPDAKLKNAGSSEICLSRDDFHSAISVMSHIVLTCPKHTAFSYFLPQVYTHTYSLAIHLPFLRHMLTTRVALVQSKAFVLLHALFESIDEESLQVKFLDLLRKNPIERFLISIMCFCEVTPVRVEALALFKKLVARLKPLGRYKILYSVLSRPIDHPGLHGQVVLMYKDYVTTNTVYQGANLHRWIRTLINMLIIDRSDDILHNSDLIYATLNFLRYIFIADPKLQNTTGIWDIVPLLKDEFLIPLKDDLTFSRGQSKLELCKLKELKLEKDKKAENKLEKRKRKVTLLTDEDSIEGQHQHHLMALQNYDVMESIMSRVIEIMEQQ